jgi:hypothetical protein
MIGLLLFLVVVGVLLYFIPMDENLKQLIYKVVAVMVILLLLVFILGYLGIWHPSNGVRLR